MYSFGRVFSHDVQGLEAVLLSSIEFRGRTEFEVRGAESTGE
jgi:hypothetical protein